MRSCRSIGQAVGRREMARERVIVIAIDSSEQAHHAFEWYLETIHKPENKVVLIHVPEHIDHERNRVQYPTSTSWDEALKKEQAKIKELEDKYTSIIQQNGLSGIIRTEGSAKPGEVIAKVAEEENATMVVMGTRGLGRVRRTIMGSVSDYVVHHAHCPVIVCRQ